MLLGVAGIKALTNDVISPEELENQLRYEFNLVKACTKCLP